VPNYVYLDTKILLGAIHNNFSIIRYHLKYYKTEFSLTVHSYYLPILYCSSSVDRLLQETNPKCQVLITNDANAKNVKAITIGFSALFIIHNVETINRLKMKTRREVNIDT
jgi:hypothetical protein